MKHRSQFPLFQATVFGTCAGDGGRIGHKPTGTSVHVENPKRPTLNGDIQSFKRFQLSLRYIQSHKIINERSQCSECFQKCGSFKLGLVLAGRQPYP